MLKFKNRKTTIINWSTNRFKNVALFFQSQSQRKLKKHRQKYSEIKDSTWIRCSSSSQHTHTYPGAVRICDPYLSINWRPNKFLYYPWPTCRLTDRKREKVTITSIILIIGYITRHYSALLTSTRETYIPCILTIKTKWLHIPRITMVLNSPSGLPHNGIFSVVGQLKFPNSVYMNFSLKNQHISLPFTTCNTG